MIVHARPIALTPGEPAGIGPDLVVQLAQRSHARPLLAIADPQLLTARARQLGLPLSLHEYADEQTLAALPAGNLYVRPCIVHSPVEPGRLNPDNAGYVLETLRTAVHLCLTDAADAMVTGPVHKGIINQAGIGFTGHTELLAQLSNTRQVVMMLTAGALRVALATTHIPLAQVPQTISRDHLRGVLRILQRDLQRHFGIPRPRITVCGLNPHAGEGGHLGREEIDVIQPVIDELNNTGFNLSGPVPADTAFLPHFLDNTDAYLAMYHDQGLPVLKYAGFGEAVNVTLGLPFIRTSVDHGTALELAGSGRANIGSMQAALALAIELVTRSEVAREQPSPAM
jgi:4-hydroxythreonine-4-phosphate dehydrogenase